MVEISSSSLSSKRLKFIPRFLPFDILINHIFLELPVRSLACCRCVCKQWLQALSEPEFATMHHKRQFQKPYNRKILCGPVYYHKLNFFWNTTLSDTDNFKKREALRGIFYILDLESSSDDVVAVRLPGFPLQQIRYYTFQTLGYSNGMVCMDTRKYMDDSMHLLFGNPSTGVYKLLPEPITGYLFGGFGYDSSSDDYKYVRVVDGMTHIFSLKSNSWRTIGYSPSKIDYEGTTNMGYSPFKIVVDANIGCFLDGSIYWLVKIQLGEKYRILCFDLKHELFRMLPPLPSRLLPHPFYISHVKMSMKVVGGSVCIIDIRCTRFASKVVMWSLFNEGKTYSWKKLMKVTLGGGDLNVDPVCFTEDGKILCAVDMGSFVETCYIVVDPKTKKIEDFTIPTLSDKLLKECSFESHLSGYIDTLVSPY